MTAAVQLSAVQLRYGATRVLDAVDLELEAGERVAVLGANGAGKTTLLRIVAGLLAPTAGEVRVLGRAPDDMRVRRAVGYLGHQPWLYGHLTAMENLRFWGRMYDAAAAGAAGAGLLSTVGIDADDRRPVSTYSEGMRQRVGLARALLHDPAIVVADEPFSGLDDEAQQVACRLLAAPGRTVVLSTHRPERAATVTRRILRLHQGRLETGTVTT